MITVCSIFRNAASYVPRYFKQIEALRGEIDVRLVLAEGDSTDETRRLIHEVAEPRDITLTIEHGGFAFGSVDNPERWMNIAHVVSGVIDAVIDPRDALIWVEGDLLWEPMTMLRLLEVGRPVAPMVYAGSSTRFYDTWGYRKNGAMFSGSPPYIPGEYEMNKSSLVKIDSCGSCFVLPPDNFASFYEWDGMWPFTAGGDLWLDTDAPVRHP
jgi:hypothetical protein